MGRKRQWDEVLAEKVWTLRAGGMSFRSIAAQVNITLPMVQRILKSKGESNV